MTDNTDDKTRQEGPPAADPVPQEPGGGHDPEAIREPAPAADQESKPAKKKKIIVVKGSDSGMTAADTRPDAAEAEGADWQDMTPHEFIEYAQDNPAAARQGIQEYFIAKFGREESEKLKEQAIKAAKAMSEAADSAVFNAMQAIAVKNQVAQQFERIQRQIFDVIAAVKLPEGANIDDLDLFLDEWDALEPFADAIIADYPAYNGMSTADLLDSLPFWWLFYMNDTAAIDDRAKDAQEAADIKAAIEIIEKARAARDQAKRKEKAKQRQREFSKISYAEGYATKIVTDKLMNDFFSIQTQAEEGHINKELNPEVLENQGAILKYGGNKGKKISLNYDYSIDERKLKAFGVEPYLDYYDAFVCIVLDNLHAEGNSSPTLTKIWHELGNTGKPNQKHLAEVFKSIVRSTSITMLSNAPQVAANMTHREVTGVFSMRQIINADFNNIAYRIKDGELAIAGGTIEIKGHSVFYDLAEQLEHLTAYQKDFLRLYKGRRTRLFYSVLYFLINQIAWMRNQNSKRGNKITYKSLYETTGARQTWEKRNTKDMMFRIIDQMFIPAGHVTRYKEAQRGEPGVLITYTKASQING